MGRWLFDGDNAVNAAVRVVGIREGEDVPSLGLSTIQRGNPKGL